jgi:ABC-type nitrate/sulfonate/bicarbonate transport system substrate-binding protein
MISRRAFLVGLGASVATLAGCGAAPAPPAGGSAKQLKPITVGYGSLGLNNAPVWVTAEGGYFAKYGLDAKMQYLDGSVVLQALSTGDLTFTGSAAGTDVPAQLQNATIKIIGAYIHYPTPALVVQPYIKSAADLKGKKFSVAAGTAEFLTKLGLQKLGLDPSKDLELPRVANGKALLASLETKAVDGAILSDPDWRTAVSEGFPLLAKLSDLQIDYEQSTLIGSSDYMRANPDITVSFLRAVNDGLQRFKQDAAFTRQVFIKYQKDNALTPDFDASYRDAAAGWAGDLSIKPAGIQTVLTSIGSSARPEDFVDTRFLAQLQ